MEAEEITQDLKQEIDQNLETKNLEEKQNTFLQSTLGKTINTAVDVGLKMILPDILEDQLIDVKNAILNNGFKEGVNTAIQSAIHLGKSALGIVSGDFENLSQVHTAIKKGGIIDSVSDIMNTVLKQAKDNKLISKGTERLIKQGKNVILNTVSSNIEDKFLGEMKSLEKVSKYIENWNSYYGTKNLEGMEREYKKIKQQLLNITPLESTLKQARKIENLHQLMKNKGINYELSEEEKELIEKL